MDGNQDQGLRPSVLVVDDDDDVRAVAAMLVNELGYPVLQANRAVKALEMLRSSIPIGLLLTDLAMPDLSGADLAHLAKRIRPDMKVLYTSAYFRGDTHDNPALRYGPLLEKPWVLRDLRAVVSQLIGRSPTS
jgi:CheY-like chemotaxis protein